MQDETQIVDNKKKVRKVRAIVLKADTEPGKSKQLPEDDPFTQLTEMGRILSPPIDPYYLVTLEERNTELRSCFDAMATNIDGFGHYFVSRLNNDVEIPEDIKKKVELERIKLENFFLYAGMEDCFVDLRKATRNDLESTGNAYWEIIRDSAGNIQYFQLMRPHEVRLGRLDRESYKVDVPILQLNEDKSVTIKKIPVWKRFRRYVNSIYVGIREFETKTYKTKWFKEFGDPRTYDIETGELVSEEKLMDWDGKGNPMPEDRKANEVKHWRLYSSRSSYGLPRFMGCIVDIEGDRKASEVNFITLTNNNIPSKVIMVSNGQLTQETVDRIQEFITKLQGDDNRSKVLVVEAESLGEEGEDSGQVKVDIKSLTDETLTDAMYKEYSAANREKVRSSFRLPPIFLGGSQDYTRSTAETSRRLADEQVFAPERNSFDNWINRILFPHMGIVYHKFKSNSPNTTDNSELVKILAGAEKTGGMTPRRADMVLQDILGQELPPFADDPRFNPDLPFSLSMAEAVKNMADASEPGQQVTALKRLGYKEYVEELFELRKQLEEDWINELRGEDDL